MRSGAAVQLGVEMVGRELGQEVAQLGVRCDAGQRVALTPIAGLEQLRRDRRRAPLRPAPRHEAGLRLTRQIEPVGDEAQRLLALGRILEPPEDLARVNKCFLAVGRSVELEPDAIEDVALRLREPLLESVCGIGGVLAELIGDSMGGEARYLATALQQGDRAARRVLAETTEDLAFGLSHVVHLFHPEVILLGGGLSLTGEPLRAAVESALRAFTMTAFAPGPQIRLAALGEDAVPVGALDLASVVSPK